MTAYEELHRTVLAALVHEDPMDLAYPDSDLTDEYDSEAREIARLLVHARGRGDRDSVAAVIEGVFAASFDTGLSRQRTHRMAAAIEFRETRGAT